MTRGTSIANLVKVRTLRHQVETRNDLRDKTDAIERAATVDLLADEVDALAQRPFGVPLGHDPYDTWNHIIDCIGDSNEILKLWKVCPLFREILSLKQKYIQTRLPQIVQVVLNWNPEFLLENNRALWNNEERVSLSTSILLNLRMISTRCKRSSEELLLQHVDLNSKKLYLRLLTAQQVRDIIDEIMGNDIMVATFFPPNVMLSGPNFNRNNPGAVIQERAELFESVGIFLELVGERMTTFSLTVRGTPQSLYAKLSEWASKLPNLENLELSAGIEYGRRNRLPPFEEIPAFPQCPKLRSIIHSPHILPKQYLQRVLQGSPSIQVLSLPWYGRLQDFPEPSEMNVTLQHLECLRAPLYAPFYNFLDFQTPLKKIIFNGKLHGCGKVSSSEIFVFLHQFRDTLVYLEFEYSVKETGKYYLDLPNLKFFKWRYNPSYKDLHFLLYAERLEEIQMLILRHGYSTSKGFFNCFLKRVTKGFDGQSIMEVFPRLKRFRMEFLMSQEHQEILRQ